MRTPVRFGKYILVERIAVGGMAEVYLAVQPGVAGFEKTVALKRIRPHLTAEEAFIKMFLFEAKLAAQLHHPNIVQIFDLGKIADDYFIAMEYLSGRDMSRVIPKAAQLGIPFPLEYAMLVASQVLEGLAYAHEKTDERGRPINLVHRDMTPENIMVGWNGHVRILDFGIAKASMQSDPTQDGEIKGKLSYMSPEQSLGRKLDHRSDLFTLGVVLYEWITGFKLFTGENEVAILSSIVDGHIQPISQYRDDVPQAVEEIVMKALARDREDRYSTAREMLFDIQHWLQTGADFTPNSGHLANFMRRMFEEEIDAEKGTLAAAHAWSRRTPVPATTLVDYRLAAQPGEAVGIAKTPSTRLSPPELIVVEAEEDSANLRPLQVKLTTEEMSRLVAAAERAGVTPSELIVDLLRVTLRYV